MSDTTIAETAEGGPTPPVVDASSDSNAPSSAGSSNRPGLGLGSLFNILRTPDLALAFAVMIILVVLLLPMPAMLLDFMLAISITFSVLILMTCLFIHKPLDFSAFPTILLLATMLRLSLNLASTRLILTNGQDRKSVV